MALKASAEKEINIKILEVNKRSVLLQYGQQTIHLGKGDTLRITLNLDVDDPIG